MNTNNNIPFENNYQDLLTPYDIIDLPSEGKFYSNKLSKVKVEYLNALDETILTSPNILRNGKFLDVLIKRKVKELNGLNHLDLLMGDRLAIIVYLRITGFGPIYNVPIQLDGSDKIVVGEIDLSTIKSKKMTSEPDENGEFEFKLPMSGKSIKFRFLTGRDEQEIEIRNETLSKLNDDGVSELSRLRLESMIMGIDGIRDKMKISNILNKIPLKDSLEFKKYYSEIEPGLDMNVEVRIPGGESLTTFLTFGSNFFGT
jgi:hypothetical protein